MKKSLPFLVIFFYLLNLSLNLALGQKKLKEEVTVIAVEVPIRVIHKGQVVKNLTKEDFEIYENGVKQEITGFEIISRKISIPQGEKKVRSKKRLFILIFNIFDYFEEVGESIDYFFQNYFHQGDQLLILTEDRIFNIERGKMLSEIIFNLKNTLKKYKSISSHITFQAYKDLRHRADRLLGILQNIVGGRYDKSWEILKFYDNYLRIWADYRKTYLTPNVDYYRSIIKRIKLMEGEKWAICFQQRELFPKLKNEGRLDREITTYVGSLVDRRQQMWARQIQSKQWELQRSFAISETFPTESLRDLFVEANITFHLLLLKSFHPLVSQDFELGEVHQDYEACLKEISFSTGGYSILSNKVSEALEEATNNEDYYYILWFTPKEKQSIKNREIKVKVRKKGVKVIYRKHFPKKESPPIAIADFKAGHRTIEFILLNYERIKIEEKLTGIADVKITLFDEDSNEVFSSKRTLSLTKKEVHISISLNKVKSGNYFIIIDVVDKISNIKDVFSGEIEL